MAETRRSRAAAYALRLTDEVERRLTERLTPGRSVSHREVAVEAAAAALPLFEQALADEYEEWYLSHLEDQLALRRPELEEEPDA